MSARSARNAVAPISSSTWGPRLTAAGIGFFFAKGMLWLLLGATLWRHGT